MTMIEEHTVEGTETHAAPVEQPEGRQEREYVVLLCIDGEADLEPLPEHVAAYVELGSVSAFTKRQALAKAEETWPDALKPTDDEPVVVRVVPGTSWGEPIEGEQPPAPPRPPVQWKGL